MPDSPARAADPTGAGDASPPGAPAAKGGRRWVPLLVALVIVAVTAVSLWNRRVAHEPRRQVGRPPGTVLEVTHGGTPDQVAPPVEQWSSHSIEHHAGPGYSYSFGVVEFDDQGFFWNREQLMTLGDYVRRIGASDGVILLAYAHGWNHDADVRDGNVACFQEVLRAVGMMQQVNRERAAPGGRPADPRPVVGVYLGWRGLALSPGWLNKITFWNRAAAADRVGRGGAMLETLLTLREIRRTVRPDRTKLVIVGHSLGARATFSALQPFYSAAALEPEPSPRSPAATGGWNIAESFGDLVILVNPAFSAINYRSIDERLRRRAPATSSAADTLTPHMLIAASRADEVTGWIYPKSQWIARGFEETQGDREALYQTVGNYPAYATHELVVTDGHVPPRPDSLRRAAGCSEVRAEELSIVQGSQRVGADPSALFEYRHIVHGAADDPTRSYTTELRALPGRPAAGTPYMLVSVAPALIPGHNEIFGSGFVDFLIRIVNRKTRPPTAPPLPPRPSR